MIGAIEGNQTMWCCDKNGNQLPDGEYHAVRGPMGPIGGKNDFLCKEILDPLASIANDLFHAGPLKLKPVPKFVSDAFDIAFTPSIPQTLRYWMIRARLQGNRRIWRVWMMLLWEMPPIPAGMWSCFSIVIWEDFRGKPREVLLQWLRESRSRRVQ